MRNIVPAAVLLTAASLYFLLPPLVPLTMRSTALLLILLAAASSAVLLIPRLVPPSTPPPVVVHSQGPTIEKLERLSQLVTTRVHVADVLVGEGANCRGAWLIKGSAIVSVNLGKATIVGKDGNHEECHDPAASTGNPTSPCRSSARLNKDLGSEINDMDTLGEPRRATRHRDGRSSKAR